MNTAKILERSIEIAKQHRLYNGLSLHKRMLLYKKLDILARKEICATTDMIAYEIQVIKLMQQSEVVTENQRCMEQIQHMTEEYPDMSKEEEIDLLKKLCYSNSYFAMEFRDKFEQMKQNINNDLPILL